MAKLTRKQIDKKLNYWNIHQPKTDEQVAKRTSQFRSLAKDNFEPKKTYRIERLKGCKCGYLGSFTYLKCGNNYIGGCNIKDRR